MSASRVFRFFCLLFLVVPLRIAFGAEDRPDIVWIVIEDMSPNWRCYGETLVETPNLDGLAGDGIRFDRAYVTAPVCSTARSALITGMYQTSIGAHHHTSSRGELTIEVPDDVRLLPELFHEAGYAVLNQSVNGLRGNPAQPGKTDYNFVWDKGLYDGFDPDEVASNQPIFIQYQLAGGKLRGSEPGWTDRNRERLQEILPRIVDPQEVVLPPYYPNHPEILDDWAAYLNACMVTDWEIGRIVDEIKTRGRWDQTILFVFTDHGISHARGKQFCYEEGMRIPLIVTGPGLPRKQIRRDLVEHIDIAAASLALAGIEIPGVMQGRDLFSGNSSERTFAVSARDRCDETIDHIRAVVTEDFKYIRNYLPNRPLLQPCAYKDAKAILQALRDWEAEGLLSPIQEQLLFAPQRPMEELYDLRTDPWELRNLAADPAFGRELAAMRERLALWEETTVDLGRIPESELMYQSEAIARLAPGHGYSPEKEAAIRRNIELNLEWARQED